MGLFGRKDEVDADQFWQNREEEIGAPVLGKTLGRVIREESSIPLWGLFYTTEKALFFQTFASENWLSSMFSQGGKKTARSKDETIEISIDSIQRFAVREQKSTLLGFFKKPPVVELLWTDSDTRESRNLNFEMEGDAQEFVATLPLT